MTVFFVVLVLVDAGVSFVIEVVVDDAFENAGFDLVVLDDDFSVVDFTEG